MTSWQPTPENNYGFPVQQPPPPEPPKRNLVPFFVIGGGVIVVAVAVVVALTSGGGPSPTTTTTSTAPPSLSAVEKDAAFYQFVQRHPYSEDGNTREDWIGLAGSMCGAFDRGAKYNDVATILIDDMSMDLTDAKEFVSQAVTVYCPEHLSKVN